MKIKKNPKLNVGDRVYVESVFGEPNFITPARGKVTKIDYQGKDKNGKEIIKYEVKWDEGTIGGLPIMAPVDVFFRQEDVEDEDIKENYTITKKQLTEMIYRNKIRK